MEASSIKGGTNQDPLDDFAGVGWAGIVRMMFWKQRIANPSFSMEVTKEDLDTFNACMTYLGVTPHIRIFRPQGAPARAETPATSSRSAIPARPAGTPKDYVVMQMVDEDGNAIVPVESDVQDHQRMHKAKARKILIETAPALARALRADIQSEMYSTATIEQAAAAILELCQ